MTPITDGSQPLYNARAPSSRTMTLVACIIPVYCFIPFPSTCTVSRPRTISNGYVALIAKTPAPAPAMRRVTGPSCAFSSLSRARLTRNPSRNSYARNFDALFGTILTQFAPFPLNIPRTPSVRRICDSPPRTPLYDFVVLPATCCKILRRSSGATAVRETPPATPPASKDLHTLHTPTLRSFDALAAANGRDACAVEQQRALELRSNAAAERDGARSRAATRPSSKPRADANVMALSNSSSVV
mmetsp:Transcript_9470/g.34458  ORF Transcript_9470/g.34458 Transcript_9470/m.34458 type:complete len:244 (-) Transcript_9470:114-845(-)